MPIYNYKARDNDGLLKIGEIEADSIKAAKINLADHGLFPVEVSSKGISINFGRLFGKKKGDIKELIGMTRQFAALFRAGVTMDRILTTLTAQAKTDDMKAALEQVRKDVSSGMALSAAFGKHPQYFNDLYVNMVAVGELGGVLDETLKELTAILQRDNRIVSGVKSATLYPKIVIVAFVAVFVLMMIYVVPGFASFYSGYGAELPLATRIMIGISDFFVETWYIALIIVVAAVIGVKKYSSSAKGRMKLDELRYRWPVFGKLNLMVANARFCHLVSTLYKSGLPLSRTLPVVGATLGNKAFQKDVDEINEDVEKGSGLAKSMEKKRYFTSLVVESTAVGESSGSLDEMLAGTGEFYDEEITDMLDRLTTLIEPLLLVGIFAMVALLAMAIFMPMWNVANVVLPNAG